jgi:hypothetical protein
VRQFERRIFGTLIVAGMLFLVLTWRLFTQI